MVEEIPNIVYLPIFLGDCNKYNVHTKVWAFTDTHILLSKGGGADFQSVTTCFWGKLVKFNLILNVLNLIKILFFTY